MEFSENIQVEGLFNLVMLLITTGLAFAIIFRATKFPVLIGYLVLGVTIGPNFFGILHNNDPINNLAEFGIVFLMFTVGLEFSLSKLSATWKLSLGWGFSQVLGTIVVFTLLAYISGLGLNQSLVVASILTMSSTAILAKSLSENSEINRSFGKISLGTLLFQDLAVIPMIIILPTLGSTQKDFFFPILFAILSIFLVLILVLYLGQKICRPWFKFIANQKSPEIFSLNVICVTLGLSWITHNLNLSLALGAFLAGILISETEFRKQVEENINPFKNILLGLFFITVGMKLDTFFLLQNFFLVMALTVLVFVIKFMIIALIGYVAKTSFSSVVRSALMLSGTGEFGIILLSQSTELGIFSNQETQLILAILILSMVLSTLIIQRREKFLMLTEKGKWLKKSSDFFRVTKSTIGLNYSILICGFGEIGQNLAKMLNKHEISFIAIEINEEKAKDAAAAGERIVSGDASRPEILLAAGITGIRTLVICYSERKAVKSTLETIHKLGLDSNVITYAENKSDADKLEAMGITKIIVTPSETSLGLTSCVLQSLGIPNEESLIISDEIRQSKYKLFDGYFSDSNESTATTKDKTIIHSVKLDYGSWAINKTQTQLGLADLNAEIVMVRRAGKKLMKYTEDTRFKALDTLVLRGLKFSILSAEIKIKRGD